MTRVVFLGCNHNQVPYLQAARELGFTVIGTDLNPEAPGAKLADRFYPVGYTDRDGLLEVARQEGLKEGDRIFTAAAHLAYEGAAHLAAAASIPFPSPEAVAVCLDKSQFYLYLRNRGIPVPPTWLYDPANPPQLDPGQVYFLKSDYGKSPRYLYRVIDGVVPPLPQSHDRFYRRHFLLQEAVAGMHIRLNLYGDQAAVFYKFSDRVAVPMPVLGPGHSQVVAQLSELVASLGLEGYLTKFDLIVNEHNWYVIDIGLDPPMRMRLLCEWAGIDFPAAYVRHYLLGEPAAIPQWAQLYRPVVIRGSLSDPDPVQPLEV